MFITTFSDNLIKARVDYDNGLYVITGRLQINNNLQKNYRILYRAAEPSDLRRSVAGSALPAPNAENAYGSNNSGEAQVDRYGNFRFHVYNPNSYYLDNDIANGIGQGKLLSTPHIDFTVISAVDKTKKDYHIKLNLISTLRSLTNYPGKYIRSTGRNTPSMFV